MTRLLAQRCLKVHEVKIHLIKPGQQHVLFKGVLDGRVLASSTSDRGVLTCCRRKWVSHQTRRARTRPPLSASPQSASQSCKPAQGRPIYLDNLSKRDMDCACVHLRGQESRA